MCALPRKSSTVSDHATLEGPHLKGRFFQARFDYVREYYGYEALAGVVAALPGEERERFADLDRDAWYPFRSLNALDRLIARRLAPVDPGAFLGVGGGAGGARTPPGGRD